MATYKEFLEDPIKKQIEKIGSNFPFHAFILDAIAIELIGRISKNNEHSQVINNGDSKGNFISAIENYFPNKYHPYSEFLYTNLRCGLAHFFAPKPKLDLKRKSEVKNELDNLKVLESGQLLLVFEYFHKDLCSAVDKLIGENKPLLSESFLNT